ncbi:hypothetical protein CUMW_147920 [Citrus unshiu]|uniref:Uncharacterized protein n=1 Tax=Citrus unshiu TaxID=55188 RepID=A0A2H5PLM8_CITUN|nr:hypothetical protein CUMW_147920 [Citrus unshiu]
MSLTSCLQACFTSIITFISGQLGPSSNPPPSSSSTDDDSESQQVAAPIPNTEQKINPNQFLLQWQNVVLAFCFTSTIEIAVLFEQTKSPLSVSFYLLSFVILIIFLSLFVAKSVGQNFTATSQVLEKVAVLLAATSFIITITIPFPLWLKCTAWALYALCLIIIVICNKLM